MPNFFNKISRFFGGSSSADDRIAELMAQSRLQAASKITDRQQKMKVSLLSKIEDNQKIDALAREVDEKIASGKISNRSKKTADRLVRLASKISTLPKVSPRVAWRERVRERLLGFGQNFAYAFRQATAALVLVALVGGVAVGFLVWETPSTLAEVGEITFTNGIVKIREQNSSFFTPVLPPAIVRVGDTIRTENGAANVRFFDDSEMQIGSQTEVAISDFRRDEIDPQKSAVKVALLSGEVETTVAKQTKDSADFEIETPAGKVGAQKAKFAVKVDRQSGATEVATSEEVVAVRPTDGKEVALAAGESAMVDSSKVLISSADATISDFESDETDPETENATSKIDLVKIGTAIDVARIRLLDALVAAQNDEIEAAKRGRKNVFEELAQVSAELGGDDLDEQSSQSIALLLQKEFDADVVEDLLADLNEIEELSSLLNFYFVDPVYLVGSPEFELLSAGYQPPAELKYIFAVAKSNFLARDDARVLAKEITLAETDRFANKSFNESEFSKLLAKINEPVYLPFFRDLRLKIPTGWRHLVDRKIVELEESVDAYVGEADLGLEV